MLGSKLFPFFRFPSSSPAPDQIPHRIDQIPHRIDQIPHRIDQIPHRIQLANLPVGQLVSRREFARRWLPVSPALASSESSPKLKRPKLTPQVEWR